MSTQKMTYKFPFEAGDLAGYLYPQSDTKGRLTGRRETMKGLILSSRFEKGKTCDFYYYEVLNLNDPRTNKPSKQTWIQDSFDKSWFLIASGTGEEQVEDEEATKKVLDGNLGSAKTEE